MSLKRLIISALGIAVVIAAGFDLLDYTIWRYREAPTSGKTEYDFRPPQQETCVNSWFPHAGYSPCWYERKHTEKEIRI